VKKKKLLETKLEKKERKPENTGKHYSKGKCIIHSSIYKKTIQPKLNNV